MIMEGKKRDCYCHKCRQQTHHEILKSYVMSSGNEDFAWSDSYEVARCCGCDELTFLKYSIDDSYIDQDGDYIPVIETFPYHEGEADFLPTWSMPYDVSSPYIETLKVYNTRCFLLAAAGCRMIIEAVCIDKKVSGKTLESRINNLCRSGFISKEDKIRLHSIRFMGNDSVHHMKMPSEKDLRIVLEIINSTLKSLYVLKTMSQGLEQPVSDFEEFVTILVQSIDKREAGESVTLDNLLAGERRVMKEERKVFEKDLIDKITDGSFTRLSLLGSPKNGAPQGYIVNGSSGDRDVLLIGPESRF